ncbi:minor tail protein [Microbacterium phage Sparcetus]|nr:minor tail protein [Microbacterium phage Sparcetus]
MTMTSWPYVAADTTDIEYGRLYREMAASDGVVGSLGTNGLQVFANSAGMNVRVRAGSAILRGYMFYSTAEEVLTVAAAESSARIDRVVLELNLSAPTIPERIKLKVLKGVAGSSPAAPALTQDATGIYQISLALVNIPASATNVAAGNVVDDRYWMDFKMGAWVSDARRPANPVKYKVGYNEARDYYEFWNGTSWVPLVSIALTSAQLTGVLPISKGGTGANSVKTAREALDLYVQTNQPGYAANRLWFKIPS